MYSTHTEDELERKQKIQAKQYLILNELQNMTKALPAQHQHRLSSDLLIALSSCLLDSTIFPIVEELLEIQHLTEDNLSDQRKNLACANRDAIDKLIRKQRQERLIDNSSKLHEKHKEEIRTLRSKHDDELRQLDMKIINELDKRVKEQQQILQVANVPGFYLTTDPDAIQVQMLILEFILKLSNSKIIKD